MRTPGDQRGLTILEVLVAASVLVVGLLGTMRLFPTGYLDLTASGGQSKATAYAQQKLEELENQPFTPGPVTSDDSLERGTLTRAWRITPVAGTTAPNRLARIVVTVDWPGAGSRPQTVTLETMRAE